VHSASSLATWLIAIADQWPSIQAAPPHVTTLTHHYYFGGPATNPEVNIPNLLKPATMQKVQDTANIAAAAASKIGARVRMTEGNTCYRGGKPGVSDVFAAALWSADYSLLLASNDYSGVNLSICTVARASLSPIPLADLCPATCFSKRRARLPNRLLRIRIRSIHRLGHLGPTMDYVLEPVAYGLRFAGSFSGGTLLKTDFSSKLQDTGVNATAYAAKLPRRADIRDHSE
jgi:hypothetical protein